MKDCMGSVFYYEYNKDDLLAAEIQSEAEPYPLNGQGKPENQNVYRYNGYGSLLTKTDGAGTVQEENWYLPDGKLGRSREADGQEQKGRKTSTAVLL